MRDTVAEGKRNAVKGFRFWKAKLYRGRMGTFFCAEWMAFTVMSMGLRNSSKI